MSGDTRLPSDGIVTLSLFRLSDAAILRDGDRDPEHRRRFAFPDEFVPSLRHSEDTISRWDHERVAGERFSFAVREVVTGDLLGDVNCGRSVAGLRTSRTGPTPHIVLAELRRVLWRWRARSRSSNSVSIGWRSSPIPTTSVRAELHAETDSRRPACTTVGSFTSRNLKTHEEANDYQLSRAGRRPTRRCRGRGFAPPLNGTIVRRR